MTALCRCAAQRRHRCRPGPRTVRPLSPTLPILLANLVSVGQVAVTYQPAIEQLLVLLPAGIDNLQGATLANRNTKQAYRLYLDFNLNFNLPPPCTTGFLPARNNGAPSFQDAPARPAGDLYCRIPQDADLNAVRGARNFHASPARKTRTHGQDVRKRRTIRTPQRRQQLEGRSQRDAIRPSDPQVDPGPPPLPQPQDAPPTAPDSAHAPSTPLAITHYDPATGTYVGPDGRVYTQADLAQHPQGDKTWQQLLTPPTN